MPELPPPLSIRLLGPLQVELHGVPMRPLRSRKSGWALALLALRGGEELSREWLAETLWPESLPEAARASLRQVVADLRRALDDQAWRFRTPDARVLSLDVSGAEVDVAEFDRVARSEDPARLESAVALYRGPLLQGCAEPWALPEREAREQGYLQALETLAGRSLACGRAAEAAGTLRRAAAVDPLRQRTCRMLMHALVESGDPQAAIEAYHGLRRGLLRECGSEPAAETTALFQQIRAAARGKAAGRTPDRPEPGAGARAAGRLPCPLTALIGRERELAEVSLRLADARLVTLAGTGGVGKTRLAVEVARRGAAGYADGAAFVDLSALAEPDRAAQAVAVALGVEETRSGRPRGEGEPGADPWLPLLLDALEPRDLLLVLDNCEHLLPACARLARAILERCPGVRVLTTSRQRLGVTGEVVYPVSPLGLPVEDEDVEAAAVRLFLERAAAVRPDFAATPETLPLIAGICRQLDGLPLAIELAAALADVLSPAEIAAGLEDRFRLLRSRDPTQPPRHQTLQALVDWSYERLPDPERALLRRLAVFPAGCALEGAAAVSGGCAPTRPGLSAVWENLAQLVAKSLVAVETAAGAAAAPSRYRLLETIRQYAAVRLREAGEEADAARRLLVHALRLVEEAEPVLTSTAQGEWLARLDAEYPNLRAALAWAAREAAPAADREPGLRLAGALGRYWQIRGAFTEGREWLLALLARAGEPGAGGDERLLAARMKALGWAAFLAVYQQDYAEAQALAEASLKIARQAEDAPGIAAALGTLAIVARDRGEAGAAESLFRESLARWRSAGDPLGEAGSLGYLGILAAERGDLPSATTFYEQSLALRRRLGDRWGVAAALNNLGLAALQGGDPDAARPLLEESLALRRELGDRRCIAVSLNHLGALACERGDDDEARRRFAESLEIAAEIGDRRSLAYSLEAFARLAARRGDAGRAVRLGGAAAALRSAVGAPLSAADRARHEAAMAAARVALGESEWAAEWSAGARLPMGEAIEDALADPGR